MDTIRFNGNERPVGLQMIVRGRLLVAIANRAVGV